MKSPKTIRQETYKNHLYPLIESNEQARLLKNRYEVMKGCLQLEWVNTMKKIGKDTLDEFLKDVVYLDRKIRDATEPYDKEAKVEAEKKWLEENYQPTP